MHDAVRTYMRVTNSDLGTHRMLCRDVQKSYMGTFYLRIFQKNSCGRVQVRCVCTPLRERETLAGGGGERKGGRGKGRGR